MMGVAYQFHCTKVTKYCDKLENCRHEQYLDPVHLIWAISNSASSTINDVPEHQAQKIIPFVSVGDAAAYIGFLPKAFNAEVAYPAPKDATGKVCRHSTLIPD